jgi:hypothetical protein
MEALVPLTLTLNNMNIRMCYKCKIEKPITDFNKNQNDKFGFNSICRDCQKIYKREWVKLNKKKISKYMQDYRKNHSKKLNKMNKAWRNSHTEHLKKYRNNQDIKFLYNITREEYNNILNKQNGVCAICGNQEIIIHGVTKQIMKLSVDHNHKTGKVRGLLCGHCNKALGGFKDNQEILNRAILYLKEGE